MPLALFLYIAWPGWYLLYSRIPGIFQRHKYLAKSCTLESGIDVGQGINVVSVKFCKKNKRRGSEF